MPNAGVNGEAAIRDVRRRAEQQDGCEQPEDARFEQLLGKDEHQRDVDGTEDHGGPSDVRRWRQHVKECSRVHRHRHHPLAG